MLSLAAHRFIEELEAGQGPAVLVTIEQALNGAGYSTRVVFDTAHQLADLGLIQLYESSAEGVWLEASLDRDRVERAYRDGQLRKSWFTWVPPLAKLGPRSRLSPLAARLAGSPAC